MLVHEWFVDQREYERHVARRGRRHAFEHINPESSALVVIDMVPFFVEQNPYVAGIVANVDSLARTVRSAGGLVAWVVPAVTEPTAVDVEFYGREVAASYGAAGGDGEVRGRLWAEFEVSADDVVVEKSAASAFFPGRCTLAAELAERDIDTVLIAGAIASVCCESSARDARTLGYRVVMVADATAAGCDDELNATLHTIHRSFGDVRSVAELVDLLAG